MKETRINIQKCIGCGLCTTIYEEAYELYVTSQQEEKAKRVAVDAGDTTKFEESIEACPVDAISWNT